MIFYVFRGGSKFFFEGDQRSGKMDTLGHSNVFICFESLKNPKTYHPSKGKKQTRENNKIHADILELCLIIKISHINGKGLESTI
jgi:hypothetical protein